MIKVWFNICLKYFICDLIDSVSVYCFRYREKKGFDLVFIDLLVLGIIVIFIIFLSKIFY